MGKGVVEEMEEGVGEVGEGAAAAGVSNAWGGLRQTGFMPHDFTDPRGRKNGCKPAAAAAATKQSRDSCNWRNIYPSGGDRKSPPLLAVGGHIR